GEVEPEARRHDADDGVSLLVGPDRLSQHVRPAAEVALPGAVGEQRDPRAPLFALLGPERAAEHGRDAERPEETSRPLTPLYHLRLIAARDGDAAGGEGRHALEAAAARPP